MTPAASLVAPACPRARMTKGPVAGGAARVGATARQPSSGVTLSMPATTLAGRVRGGSPRRQGLPMSSTCPRARAALEPHVAHAAATALAGVQAPAASVTT
eukprot:6107978-Alexandrium_andersonii.AAC.1